MKLITRCLVLPTSLLWLILSCAPTITPDPAEGSPDVLVDPPRAFLQSYILEPGPDGLFAEDLSYTLPYDEYYLILNLGKDGSFEQLGYSFENGEDLNGNGIMEKQWVLTDGMRGTYRYDMQKKLITETIGEYFTGIDGNTSERWQAVETLGNRPNSIESSMILFENFVNDFYVMTGSDTYACLSRSSYPHGLILSSEHTYSFSETTVTKTSTRTFHDSTGSIRPDLPNNRTITTHDLFDMNPEGEKREDGNSVSYLYRTYTETFLVWDSVSRNWIHSQEPDRTVQSIRNLGFSFIDNGLVMTPSAIIRGK